jgi:CTP-dependent riboflavin kinase
MITVTGRLSAIGFGDFRKRMTSYPEVFREATGEELYPGTLNVWVDEAIPIREHFRIWGKDIGEPDQDLLFEVCRVNGIWAYRVRPFVPVTGSGGHGDNVIEIACDRRIQDLEGFDPKRIQLTFFREKP